jgi:AmiR/NasT family two-component response regulator
VQAEALEIHAPRDAWPSEAVEAVDELLRRVADLRQENEQLRGALETRALVEQAKGVLAERYALMPDQALDAMRRSAHSSSRRLDEVAAEIVASRRTPVAIVRELQGPRSAA